MRAHAVAALAVGRNPSSRINFVTSTWVGKKYATEKLRAEFDAVVLCGGATKARDLPIEGRTLQGIHYAMEYLLLNTLVQFEILSRPPDERAADNPWPRRYQVVILRRKSPRPRLTTFDRLQFLVAAAVVPTLRRALAIVQPDTLLRWHREGFRILWRRRSRAGTGERRIAADTVTLIREMATKNRMWGAERIRGELLKVGIIASKLTVQKYMRAVRGRRGGQTWTTFVKNHADDIWCCDFVQTYDLLFRPLYLFFLMNQGTRKVIHIAATRNPSQKWTAQQLRNATMEGVAPRFLIRDRDEKFGATFDRAAEGGGIRVIKTAVRAPNMNPVGERFVGSQRREALDHVLLSGEDHLRHIAAEYVTYFNRARPHQGIRQRIPDGPVNDNHDGRIVASSVLGGLHHDYRRVA